MDAIESSKQAIRPGIKATEIDAVARDIVVRNGYEEFPHGLGHQVGRFSHDGTALFGPPSVSVAPLPAPLLAPSPASPGEKLAPSLAPHTVHRHRRRNAECRQA